MKPSEVLNLLSTETIKAAIDRNGVRLEQNGCHIFLGPKTTGGYGRLNIGRVRIQAHRGAWVVEHGPMDLDKDACHRCDTRDCVNPAHIFPGSRRENMMDASAKKRLHAQTSPDTMPRGEGHGMSKITLDDAHYIKTSRDPSAALRDRFGISRSTVNRIRAGDMWAKQLDEYAAIRALQKKEG